MLHISPHLLLSTLQHQEFYPHGGAWKPAGQIEKIFIRHMPDAGSLKSAQDYFGDAELFKLGRRSSVVLDDAKRRQAVGPVMDRLAEKAQRLAARCPRHRVRPRH